jgi:hypothetical protein
MDTTHGSETDEEDNEDTAQHYLNKMTDDTDRIVETVFGKGVEVWKSFNGTVYADVDDETRKKQRDEEMWGKKKKKKTQKEKRKRGGSVDKQGKMLQGRLDSLRNSTFGSGYGCGYGSGSGFTSTPSLTHSSYTDGSIAYPLLCLSDKTSLPSTPTASEWEIFPVSQSQYDDFSAAPLEYTSIRNRSATPSSADRRISRRGRTKLDTEIKIRDLISSGEDLG